MTRTERVYITRNESGLSVRVVLKEGRITSSFTFKPWGDGIAVAIEEARKGAERYLEQALGAQ